MNNHLLKQKQQGFALFLGLILLLAATAVTVVGMQGSNMQERMTFNQHHKAISHNQAETGISNVLDLLKGPQPQRGQASTALSSCAATGSTSISTLNGLLGTGNTYQITGCSQISTDPAPRQYELVMRGWSGSLASPSAITDLRFIVSPAGGGSLPEAAFTCYGPSCTANTGSNSNSAVYYDGRDWNLPNSDSCTGSGCDGSLVNGNTDQAGIYFVGNDDENSISTGNKDGEDSRPGQIQGDPDRKFTDETVSEAGLSADDWRDYVNRLQPDHSLEVPTVTTLDGFMGSRNDQKIIEVTGNGSLRFSGSTHAAGIIVIRGNVEISPANGTFTFEGLIILDEGATLSAGKGTANVFGAIISLDGQDGQVDADLGGNFSLKYSTEALNNLNDGGMPGSAVARVASIREII